MTFLPKMITVIANNLTSLGTRLQKFYQPWTWIARFNRRWDKIFAYQIFEPSRGSEGPSGKYGYIIDKVAHIIVSNNRNTIFNQLHFLIFPFFPTYSNKFYQFHPYNHQNTKTSINFCLSIKNFINKQ